MREVGIVPVRGSAHSAVNGPHVGGCQVSLISPSRAAQVRIYLLKQTLNSISPACSYIYKTARENI